MDCRPIAKSGPRLATTSFYPCPSCGWCSGPRCWRHCSKHTNKGSSRFQASSNTWLGAAFQQWWGRLLCKDWVVHVKPPIAGGPDRVLKYLARYVYRVGISNGRLLELSGDQVTFSYRDYSQEGQPEKRLTLSADHFLGQFLQHVLPPGFVRIRYYGFLGGPEAAKRIDAIRQLIATPTGDRGAELTASADPQSKSSQTAASPQEHQQPESIEPVPSWPGLCPKCGAAPMREIPGGPRFVCRELWSVLWHLFPPWPLEPHDSS